MVICRVHQLIQYLNPCCLVETAVDCQVFEDTQKPFVVDAWPATRTGYRAVLAIAKVQINTNHG